MDNQTHAPRPVELTDAQLTLLLIALGQEAVYRRRLGADGHQRLLEVLELQAVLRAAKSSEPTQVAA